jgi:ATP-dependent Clp protease ATP-binding subunit ClpC
VTPVPPPSPQPGGSSKKEGSSALEDFCRDLCKEAASQRTDPVIGRQKEVLRVTQILARKKKNNPILLGEPGVGKTAIAEGLARAIVARTNADGSPLPDFLHSKRVMQLDVGLLIAGAKVRTLRCWPQPPRPRAQRVAPARCLRSAPAC